MKKKCFVMRGIPGSGKSTLARQLAGESGKIHSTDDYFVSDGKYVHDRSKLAHNHTANLRAFKRDIEHGEPLVIVDNTNSKKWEYEKYEQFAVAAGYSVEVVCVPHIDPKIAAERNIHGCPEATIRQMLLHWED